MTVFGNPKARFSSVSMVTASLGANDPEVGTVCREGDEEYIFVYNNGTSQISPGYGAIVSGVSGYSVTVSSVTDVDNCVGICRHATLTTGTYGWLVTKGFTQVQMGANNSAAVGDMLILGTDGVAARKTWTTGIAPAFGKAMAAIASGASGTAFVSVF